jgi:hypothetical protein
LTPNAGDTPFSYETWVACSASGELRLTSAGVSFSSRTGVELCP